MRILLTGASGQVGGALRPSLAAHGTIIAPSSSEFDLSKPETLPDRLKDIRPDLIVNPAAYTAVDRAEEQRELVSTIHDSARSLLVLLNDILDLAKVESGRMGTPASSSTKAAP